MNSFDTAVRRRAVALWGALLVLMGVTLPARAADVTLSATFGIGGRYRPGTWLPMTVRLTHNGPTALQGQVRLRATSFWAMPGAAGTVWARPVRLSPSPAAPQTVTLCARSIDPDIQDVTLQLTGSDGRVLAGLASPAGAPTPSFSGAPIESRDLLLVGWAGDASAFTFLNGQGWGLQHVRSGPVLGPRAPSTRSVSAMPSVQIAVASPEQLPDRPAGLSGVDAFLLRADAPLEAVTEAQGEALREWVASGGHLIVCAQSDPSRLDAPFFTGLLPARVGPPREPRRTAAPTPVLASSFMTLIPRLGPGVRVLGRSPDGLPFAVAGPYGAGRVVLTAFDPTTPAFRGWTGPDEAAFWRGLILGGAQPPSSLLAAVAGREERPSYGYGLRRPQLTQAVERATRPDTPPARAIGLYFLLYVIILAPVNYAILKRLHKQELAWLTIPGLIALFAAGAYGLGPMREGSGRDVSRLAIVETTAGSTQAGVYSSVAVFSAHRATKTLSLPDPNALAAPPPATAGMTKSDQPLVVQTPDALEIQNVTIPMWGMRAWDVQTTVRMDGAFDAGMFYEKSRKTLHGTVQNHTRFDLMDCAILYHNRWQTLGPLPHGGGAHVALSESPTKAASARIVRRPFNTFLIPTGGGALIETFRRDSARETLPSDRHARLRAVLAEYARSLGDDRFHGYASPGLSTFTPGSDEAILIGWCDDPDLAGPAPLLDNRPAGTGDTVSLLVVHVPVGER